VVRECVVRRIGDQLGLLVAESRVALVCRASGPAFGDGGGRRKARRGSALVFSGSLDLGVGLWRSRRGAMGRIEGTVDRRSTRQLYGHAAEFVVGVCTVSRIAIISLPLSRLEALTFMSSRIRFSRQGSQAIGIDGCAGETVPAIEATFGSSAVLGYDLGGDSRRTARTAQLPTEVHSTAMLTRHRHYRLVLERAGPRPN